MRQFSHHHEERFAKDKKFFSDNIIFFDAEFNGLSETGTTLLSVGMVKPIISQELYIELMPPKNIDHWVIDNVLPYMKNQPETPETVKQKIISFVGDAKPYLVADVNQFDWMGICGLFGVWNQPFNYIPIDFASILWTHNIDPDRDRIDLCKQFGVDTNAYKKHNALDDARVLSRLYYAIEKI